MRVVNFKDHPKEIAQIFAKAWTDELFKQRLLNNPEEVFKEFGIAFKKKGKIHFHFDDKDHFNINFPIKPQDEEISEEELKMIVGGLTKSEGTDLGIGGGMVTLLVVAGAI